MRILQVISSLRVGGAEKIVKDLTIALNNRGNEVEVAVFDGTDSPIKRELIEKGCTIYEFSSSGSIYSPLNIIRLLRLIKSYDIIHTHNTAPQFFAAICSLFNRAVYITTEHNTINRRRGIRFFLPFDKWMYSRYNAIVSVSEDVNKNLKEYIGAFSSRLNLIVISNGVDVNRFYNASGYDRERFCKSSVGKYVVCMVAGFRKQKDQDTLIRAFSFLPKDRFELWLVGDGERRKELEELVSSLDLDSNVVFWGIRSDVAAVLHTSDAIVMSSHYEGLSLSSLEGMAVGKPFIASDVDGLRDIVKEAGLLFPHQNEKTLAEIIQSLSNDSEMSRNISTRCFKRASCYSLEKMVDRYESLYSYY